MKALKEVKEFYEKHEKKIKTAGLVALGAGLTGGVVLLHKKYVDASPKSFITDPKPIDGGDYIFEFGLVTKLGRKARGGSIAFSPEDCIKFGEGIVNIVKTCEESKKI